VSLTGPERETIITMCDEDGHACIYSAQRRIITKLKKNEADRGRHLRRLRVGAFRDARRLALVPLQEDDSHTLRGAQGEAARGTS
jgi:hypothetical protein